MKTDRAQRNGVRAKRPGKNSQEKASAPTPQEEQQISRTRWAFRSLATESLAMVCAPDALLARVESLAEVAATLKLEPEASITGALRDAFTQAKAAAADFLSRVPPIDSERPGVLAASRLFRQALFAPLHSGWRKDGGDVEEESAWMARWCSVIRIAEGIGMREAAIAAIAVTDAFHQGDSQAAALVGLIDEEGIDLRHFVRSVNRAIPQHAMSATR